MHPAGQTRLLVNIIAFKLSQVTMYLIIIIQILNSQVNIPLHKLNNYKTEFIIKCIIIKIHKKQWIQPYAGIIGQHGQLQVPYS